jgi:hypothetical protein
VIRESFPAQSTYQLQLEAFVKRIRGEESNALAPEDAVLTARVLDAMFKKALALRGTLQKDDGCGAGSYSAGP